MTAVCATSLQVDRIAGRWRAAPPITVVATPEDLPVPAPDDARGMLWDGQAWLVEANLEADTVASTLAHEVIAHHGLRAALGPAWRSFMGAIQSGARGSDVHLEDLRYEVRRVYGRLPDAEEADEMAAGVLERSLNPSTGRFETDRPVAKRAAASLAHFIRERLYFDLPATYDQLEGALLAAQHHVTHGGQWFGIGARLQRWYAGWMSADHRGPAKPYATLQEQEEALRELESNDAFWASARLGAGLLLCLAAAVWGGIELVRLILR